MATRIAQSLGDRAPSRPMQRADHRVAQGRHDTGAVPCVDQTAILAQGDTLHIMGSILDLPVLRASAPAGRHPPPRAAGW
jgi:hypothetical protein